MQRNVYVIAIPTDMFTKQIRQNFKSATVKISCAQADFWSVIPMGDLASKSLLSVDTQRPLSLNLAKLPIPKSEEFEVGNGKNYLHLESAKIPFTLPMGKTKTMVLVFGFSFPFSAGFQGKSGFSFGEKWF